MSTYHRTIENGQGEEITFVRLVKEPDGDRLEVAIRVSPGGGPPMHVHYLQEEGLTITKGRLGYQRPGEQPQFAGEGDTVVFKAGEPHKFWNAGDGDLRCTGYAKPALNVEYFLTALYASQKRAGSRRPEPFEGAFLARRYASEFGMLEVPALVQKVIFPVQVAIGKLLGKYVKYDDAPPPVG